MTSRDPERSRSWPHYLWGAISRKELEIRAWSQWRTNRKWSMESRMVTLPMTSRDLESLERSRSWPNYLWGAISRKGMEIGAWSQWSTNRRWGMGSPVVTWSMTSRDLERSRSWPYYLYGPISPNALEIGALSHWSTNRKWCMGRPMVTWPMTSCDLERSRSWPSYLHGLISRKWLEIGIWSQWSNNRKLGMGSRMLTWPITSRDLQRSVSWPQMTNIIRWPQNVKIVIQMYLDANILKRQQINDRFKWTTTRNWPMANRLVTESMTSHDLVKWAPSELYRKHNGIGQTPCS